MEWKPIETAPTESDKRMFLFADGEVLIGYRNSFYQHSDEPVAPWWHTDDEGPVSWGKIEPTHWMPFPDPPLTESQPTADEH